MNRRLLTLLNLSHSPIWLKIALLIGLVLLAFAVPAFLTVRAATLEAGYENAERFLQMTSAQRVENVRQVIADGERALRSTVDDSVIRQDLLGYLGAAAGGFSSVITPEGIGDRLEERLLDPATTQFTNIRLIDQLGQVVTARATAGADTSALVGSNQINTPAFRAGVNAVVGGESGGIVVMDEGSAPFIEIVAVIKRRNGDWIGFLVGRMNMTILQSALGGLNVDYPISSYLAHDDDLLIVPAALPEGAIAPSISDGAVRALEGQTGLEQYRLANGETALGYFAPIRSGRLGFVSELSLAQIEARSVGYFAARAFSLVVGFVALCGLAIALMATLNHQIAPPLRRLRKAALALGKGDFSPEVKDSQRGDEIGSLASSFVLMRDQVQALVSELQSRLEARSRDIDTTQEISRFTATQRDLQSLLDRICALLVERFPSIYHAQVFLLDAERENAILQASTGDAGQALLRRGHRLAVGSISLVGQAVEQRSMMIARDTESSDVWRPNPLLPDTRAELALPLFFREGVIGVLDVQSRQRDAFSGEQVAVLQTIANQIAVGIQTAQLYEQSVRRLEEIEEANRKATTRVWQEYMRAQRVNSMSASAGRLPEDEDATVRRAALTTGKPIVGAATARQTLPVAIPITIGGQTIGAVEWEVPAQEFDENVLDMAQELAKRLAISLENARLFQESRRAAERERMVNSIAAQLSAQTNVHEILQTAVREVGQALRTPQVSIRLHGAEKSAEY